MRSQRKADQRPSGRGSGQQCGAAHAQPQNLAPIGFQQDILHVEAKGSKRHQNHQAHRIRHLAQVCQCLAELRARGGDLGRRHRANLFLLPQRDQVQDQRRCTAALHHPDQGDRIIVAQQPADEDRRNDHADQIHDIEQRHHARPRLVRCAVGSQGQTGGLGHRHAKPGHQESQPRKGFTCPGRTEGLVARQHDQCKGHHRQPAHLPERAEPQIRNPLPPDGTAVGVRPEAQNGTQGRHQHRQRDHDRHDRGGHAQFNDHHPVQRAQQ